MNFETDVVSGKGGVLVAQELQSAPFASSQSFESSFQIVSDTGEGRPLVFISDEESYAQMANSTAAAIAGRCRVIVLRSPPISDRDWNARCLGFTSSLRGLKIRQASFVCFGATANLVESQLLREPKSIRTLVIVDGPSRPHPTSWDRLIDRIESLLPLGLPLRLGASGFNVRAYLHRIRCPLLVVTTPLAGSFLSGDATVVAKSAPTAWSVALSEKEINEGLLSETILKFQDTPAKCPQKNVKE